MHVSMCEICLENDLWIIANYFKNIHCTVYLFIYLYLNLLYLLLHWLNAKLHFVALPVHVQ